MTRISARTMKILAATVLLGGAVAGVNCSKGSTSGNGNGLLSLSSRLTSGGITVTSVNYQIVHSDGSPFAPPIAGVINTSDMNATASVDQSVPASTGDIALMTATGSDGSACSGKSMGFNVVAGQQVGVAVNIICGGSQTGTGSGSAIINGNVIAGDNCPVLTSWVASPLQTSAPTGQISVAAAATDSDSGETLTYAWTATAGTFAAATTPGVASGATDATSYTCTTVGMQTLTVTVTDNHTAANPNGSNCTVTMTFPINCASTVFCGNGVVDPGTTEQCDPPKPGFCDSNCQNIPAVCGDGIVQPPETCDDGANNGKDGICSATCTSAPVVCGDGIVSGGEQCDPPNLTTCTTSQCCGNNCLFQTFDQSPACQTCEQKHFTTLPAKTTCVGTLYSNATGFGCSSFTAAADIAACNALRTCIISKKCSAGDDPTPCYCGARDATTCASSGPDGTGACLAQYNAVALPAGKQVKDVFTDATSPIGVANNLLTCDVDGACACGQ